MSLFLFLLFGAPDTLTLNFNQALTRVYVQAPDLRLAQIEVEQKRLERSQMASEFFPKLSLQGGMLRLQEAPSFFTEIQGFPIELTLGDERIKILQTGLELPLWTFGRRLQGYALADQACRMAKLDSQNAQSEIRLQTARIYANAKLLTQSLELAGKALENAASHRSNLAEKYEQGLIPEYQLLKAQAEEKGLRPELMRIRKELHSLQMQLATLLNLGEDTVVRFSSEDLVPVPTPDFSVSVDEALERDPRYRQLQLAEEMLERRIKIKQREVLPELAAGANYTMQRSPLTDADWEGGWSYSLILRASLSQGFSYYTEVKRLQKEMEALDIQKEALRSSLRTELGEANDEWMLAKSRLEAARVGLREAQKLVSLTKKRFGEGLVSEIELMDAELALHKARNQRLEAERDLFLAIEKWRKATGGQP